GPTNAPPGSRFHPGSDRPQTSHTMTGTRSNDERHSSQRGTRLAPVNKLSQMRHPEGKNTLTSASLAFADHPRAPRRFAAAGSLDGLLCSTPARIYSFLFFN